MSGRALPDFLIQPGPVLLRRFVRNKSDPFVEEVELLDANPSFSHVRFANVRETTVSIADLALKPVDNFEATTVVSEKTITTEPEPENGELSEPCTNSNDRVNRPLLDVLLEHAKLHRDTKIIHSTRN